MIIWFGLPMVFAVISAFITGHFYVNRFKSYIILFIGMNHLYETIISMIVVIGILFGCYFISTWTLFKKNIESV